MGATFAKASPQLVQGIERCLKKASHLLNPFDHGGAERMPTREDVMNSYLLLQEAVVFVERGLRDQLANPLDVELIEIGVPSLLRLVPGSPQK
jgi:hypothetical protein